MFEPFRATVKLVVAAAPVPSLTTTKSPAEGEDGKVIVMPPAMATWKVEEVAVVFADIKEGAGYPAAWATEAHVLPLDFRTLPLVPGATT